MSKNKNLVIIIILLTIIIGGVSYFAFLQVQENKEMSELFAIEKEEMENESWYDDDIDFDEYDSYYDED